MFLTMARTSIGIWGHIWALTGSTCWGRTKLTFVPILYYEASALNTLVTRRNTPMRNPT